MSHLQIVNTAQVSVSRSWLPVELVENILQEAWSSTLSVDERTSLFRSLCLVNRTFLSSFIHIALIDVHISSSFSAEQYLYLLRERSPKEPNNDYLLSEASVTANKLCRSITFHIEGNPRQKTPPQAEPSVRLYSEGDSAASAVSVVLYMIDRLDYTPNLQHVTLDYQDWGFDDVFDQCRLMPLPEQVTHLELRYTFSKNLSQVAQCIRGFYYRELCSRWTTPDVQRLTITGAPAAFISAFVETCPGLEALEVDIPSLFGLAPLPSNVHTLILYDRHEESGDVGEAKAFPIDKWGLEAALEGGLFYDGQDKRRIVMESELGCWTNRSCAAEIGRVCDKYGLDFICVPA